MLEDMYRSVAEAKIAQWKLVEELLSVQRDRFVEVPSYFQKDLGPAFQKVLYAVHESIVALSDYSLLIRQAVDDYSRNIDRAEPGADQDKHSH